MEKTEQTKLNENDNKLLVYCMDEDKSVNQIADFLKVKPASISARIEKLKEAGLINVERGGVGKKTWIRTKQGEMKDKFAWRILKEIKNNGGRITQEQFKHLPINLTPEEEEKYIQDLLMARGNLLYGYSKRYLNVFMELTKEGENFLKENEQDRKL